MRVLVTAGPVYAHLDDNKVLSSLTRGVWAKRFSDYLVSHGHDVTTFSNMEYGRYMRQCVDIAPHVDAAVMAAAVINYVPESPFDGKMPTNLDEVKITLRRSPYVIDEIRKVNPKCTLIGCKLTSRESTESLVMKAQQLIDRSMAHAVIANDKTCLRTKYLCLPDGAVIPFNDDFPAMYLAIKDMIQDRHYSTSPTVRQSIFCPDANNLMQKLLDRYSPRFSKPWAGGSKNFGSVAVRMPGSHGLVMTTPRRKSDNVQVEDCVVVSVDKMRITTVKVDTLRKTRGVGMEGDCVTPTVRQKLKATMNAPLLCEVLKQHPEAAGVIHLHEMDDSAKMVPYAPSGTYRDSQRGDLPPRFNIEHHGLVACVNSDGELI